MKIAALKSQLNVGNTNFKGLKNGYDSSLNGVYKFYAPAFDKDKYAILLQLCSLKEGEKGSYVQDEDGYAPFIYAPSLKDLNSQGVVELSKDNPLAMSENMGYRFVLVDKKQVEAALKDPKTDVVELVNSLEHKHTITDPGVKAGGFTVISNNMGITPKSGSATHIFYDSFDSPSNVDRKKFVRTHFNKAGGDLDSLIKHKKELQPFSYVMTNPYMGADSISSHKYWGEEFFQMPSTEKFKDVVVDMFKDGKGYIADGAFTSQSLQSPLFQNVLMYGEKSPFYDWFKINGRLKLGVLPDTVTKQTGEKDVLKHLGYKIINPLGTEGYNPKKPSYIQFFDDRLSSVAQQNDTEHLIKAYDKLNPQDPYDISVHQDSVLPYHFELNYTDPDVINRFSGYSKKMLSEVVNEGSSALSPEEKLSEHFSFKNYEITTKGKSGGANYWDGNVDLVKMNLSNPKNTTKNVEGKKQAREQLYDVSTYWTKFANDALVENVAYLISQGQQRELNDILKAHGEDAKVSISDLVSDNSNQKQNLKQVVNEFKFQAIPSIPPQLAAIFASVQFEKEVQALGIREELENITLQALVNLNSKSKQPLVESGLDGEIIPTHHGVQIANHIVQNAAGYVVAKAIFPDADVELDGDKNIVKADKSLKEASIYSSGVTQVYDFSQETRQLAKILNRKLQGENENFAKQISDEYKGSKLIKCTSEDLAKAQGFVKKLGGGLNWRFDAAKDIGDLTANRNGLKTFEKSWDEVVDFWSQFVQNAREINPSSYVVAEVTNLWEFWNLVPENQREKEFGKYVNPDIAERMLYEKTGATTGSNYSTFFGLVPNLFGQNFEHGNLEMNGDSYKYYANMDQINQDLEKYLSSGPLLYLTHSHIFMDNHDKPRALHCIALDSGAYLSNFGASDGKAGKEAVDRAYQAMERVFGGRIDTDIDNVSSKAIVVADTFLKHAKKSLQGEKLGLFTQALQDLALGKFKDSTKIDFQRAETFGQNPFDITLHHVMEQAEFIAREQGLDWFNQAETKEVEDKIYASMMKPALAKMIRITDVMNSITGIPFTYAGDNLGQTGYEYASKNIAVANRNLIRHEWINSSSDEFKPEIKEYYNRMQAGASLYKKHGLSALIGGMPVPLPQDNKHDLFGLYKYDDKGSHVIQLFSNVGLNSDPLKEIDDKATTGEIQSVKVRTKDGLSVGNTNGKEYYKRLVYDDKKAQFVDEKEGNNVVQYIVKDGVLRRADSKPFVIGDAVTNFYKTGEDFKSTPEYLRKL